MHEPSISALRAPPRPRDNPLTRSLAGLIGIGILSLMLGACLLTLPYTLSGSKYDEQVRTARHLPPWWAGVPDEGDVPDSVKARLAATARARAVERLALGAEPPTTVEEAAQRGLMPSAQQLADAQPRYWMGSDLLGRSLLIRALAGGGVSLTIGLAAALLSVFLGTVYGAVAGYAGGRVDALMMRIVDVLYGLPYILLVVLLAVASQTMIEEYVSRGRARTVWVNENVRAIGAPVKMGGTEATIEELRALPADANAAPLRGLVQRELANVAHRAWIEGGGVDSPPLFEIGDQAFITKHATLGAVLEALGQMVVRPRTISPQTRTVLELTVLFIAIGGVSWLTMARVVRGQVLSLKQQPFMEAARAMGVPVFRQCTRHLLPNLAGPIIVYATLTVPQAILQESFLSFLGIGVRPPLPSWGNLAADGLTELNPYQSRWWLLLFPCLLLGTTLLALNFVGEGLREALDPKGRKR